MHSQQSLHACMPHMIVCIIGHRTAPRSRRSHRWIISACIITVFQGKLRYRPLGNALCVVVNALWLARTHRPRAVASAGDKGARIAQIRLPYVPRRVGISGDLKKVGGGCDGTHYPLDLSIPSFEARYRDVWEALGIALVRVRVILELGRAAVRFWLGEGASLRGRVRWAA